MGPWRWRTHRVDHRELRVREALANDDMGRPTVHGEWIEGWLDGVPVPPDELERYERELR